MGRKKPAKRAAASGHRMPPAHHTHPARKPAKDAGGRPRHQQTPLETWTRTLALGLAAAAAYALVCGFTSLASPVVAGLLAGALVGSGGLSERRSAATGGAAGLAGGLASAVLFTERAVATALNSMPAYANPDVVGSLYTESIWPLLRANWVNAPWLAGLGGLVVVLLAVSVTAAAAYGTALARRSRLGRVPGRTAVAWSAVALLAVCFVATGLAWSGAFRDSISREPADGSYGYDGFIALRAYYEMGKGHDYYESIVLAAAGDARLIQEKAVVDGKFRGWAFSPSFIRLPYATYLWRLVAPGGGGGILVFSLLACVGLLGLSYWAFEPRVGEAALAVPLLLFPYLFMGTIWANILMPDWWAALAGLAGMLVAVRGRLAVAAGFALAAALFREVMAIELVILLAAAAWLYVRARKPEHLRAALLAAGGLALFAAAYVLHYRAGAPLIAVEGARMTPVTMLRQSAARPLEARFLSPASYLMFPYGYFAVPGWLFLVAQLPGLAWALRSGRDARLAALLFAAFWLVFTLVVGGSSSYWGQLYLPFALAGTAALLADPGLLVAAVGKVQSRARAR